MDGFLDAGVAEKLRNVKLLSCDVDGVLTDGGLYYGSDGDVTHRFNARDGMGLRMLMVAGVQVAIISASPNNSIVQRGRRLKIEHTLTGIEDKYTALTGLCARLGISMAEVAHIGDDVNDLPVLRAVGCPLTVVDGVPEVQKVALWRSTLRGGHGAVRELCDLLLRLKGVDAAALLYPAPEGFVAAAAAVV